MATILKKLTGDIKKVTEDEDWFQDNVKIYQLEANDILKAINKKNLGKHPKRTR